MNFGLNGTVANGTARNNTSGDYMSAPTTLNYDHLPQLRASQLARAEPAEKFFMKNTNRWRTITTDSFQAPNKSITSWRQTRTEKSGFTENSDADRFFPSLETRDFILSSRVDPRPSNDNINNYWQSGVGKFGNSNKSTKNG